MTPALVLAALLLQTPASSPLTDGAMRWILRRQTAFHLVRWR